MHVQPGILALGTTDHSYLEFDGGRDVVTAAARLVTELPGTAGVNLVLGVRPALWQTIAAADDVPSDVHDWDEPLVGPDGFTMPATPHDVWLWISGGDRSVVFDAARDVLATLGEPATQTSGWLYRHDRDLTGFVDGTENPSPAEAPDVVAVPAGRPGAGSTVLLYQLWSHDTASWSAAPVDVQERAMGRTKADSIELDDLPPDSHVARTVIEVDGTELDIYRRNVAYGDVTGHGTVFVGFSHDQWRMAEMLRRMAGIGDGIRCALTRYVTPQSGAFYTVPSAQALSRLG